MNWTDAASAWTDTELPDGYSLAQLGADEVEIVTRRLQQWYPDICVGMESPHLDPTFYHEQTTLRGCPDRPILPLALIHRQDGIVGLVTYEKNTLSRTLTGRLGALDPNHRQGGLGLLGPFLLERVGRAIGAELIHYFATLKTRHQQVIAERAGYTLAGIVPAYDRDMVTEGQVKRVYEGIYAKVLVPQEQVLEPDPSSLTTNTKAVWAALFGAR